MTHTKINKIEFNFENNYLKENFVLNNHIIDWFRLAL